MIIDAHNHKEGRIRAMDAKQFPQEIIALMDKVGRDWTKISEHIVEWIRKQVEGAR